MNIIKVYLPIFLFLISTWSFAQKGSENSPVRTISNLTSKGALQVAEHTIQNAALQGKTITVVVVDASGTVIVVIKGDGVGPHNTQASEKKAFTALSTKTATLTLLRRAQQHSDTMNLNTIDSLLLLAGGQPLYYEGALVGAIGISGAGPELDQALAEQANTFLTNL